MQIWIATVFLCLLALIPFDPILAAEHTCEVSNTDPQGWSLPHEKAIADNFNKTISRPEPCTLKITFDNGKSKEFVNHTDTEDSRNNTYDIFTVDDVFKRKNFTLLQHANSMESFDYILLNMRNGVETHLSGVPVWSPKGDLFAVTQDGGDAGYVPNAAEIWSCKDNDKPCKRLFSQEDYRGWEAFWLSSTEVVFSLATGLEDTDNQKEYRLRVRCDESCKAGQIKPVE